MRVGGDQALQDLSKFKLPLGFRGRSAVTVQLWWVVQGSLFRLSPQFLYGFRRFLLRLFGAKVGRNVLLRPSVTITYPWHVSIGDYSWIGDDVSLYSLGGIRIGAHAVISQKSYICTGTHDARDPAFAIQAKPILIGDQVWVATDVFVAPGVTIGDGSVIAARSSVLCDIPAGMMCRGLYAEIQTPRETRSS
jgi:putative colanic acid biosynthesis acetyltransferase WcaF